MTTTGWAWHEVFNWHNTGNGAGLFPPGGFIQPGQPFDYPETKGRFAALVEVSGYLKRLQEIDVESVTDSEVLAVHTDAYLHKLRELDVTGGEAGESASFGAQGLSIAYKSAGAVASSVRAVMRGEVDNAYALVRPAGHHAEPDRGRGFCLLANTSIAAKIAQTEFGVERVAIVDWDVHHGNGTQAVFWEDPSVLNISLHQDRLYPVDSGMISEIGAGKGEGTTMNVPLPAGTGDGGYLEAIDKVVLPALRRYRPDLIIVGSGMDAAATDPLGRMVVTSEGFRGMARRMIDAAAEYSGGRIVFAHEGGYSAAYVPFCGMSVLEELSGVDSGVEDPYMAFFADYPQLHLEPWQAEAIGAAAVNVARVPSRE